jgi:hypothetical protein
MLYTDYRIKLKGRYEMNKNQQILKNLKREVGYLAISNNDNSQKTRRINELFDIADCTLSTKKHNCDTCKKLFYCSLLTQWNDISEKELIRKS